MSIKTFIYKIIKKFFRFYKIIRDIRLIYKKNTYDQDIVFIHRSPKFFPGYGAGTYVPELVKNKTVLNIYYKCNDLEKNYNSIEINSFYFLCYFLHKNFKKKKVFHIFSRKNMFKLASFIKSLNKLNLIIIELRSPLIAYNQNLRKKDLNDTMRVADKIIAPSINILKTWGLETFFYKKYVEVPVCIKKIPNIDNTFSQQIKEIKIIYFGSTDKKRGLENLFTIINDALKVTSNFSFTVTSNSKKLKERYEYIHFIKPVQSNKYYELLKNFNLGISYIKEENNGKYSYGSAFPTKILDYSACRVIPLVNDHPSHSYAKELGFQIIKLEANNKEDFIKQISKLRKENLNKIKLSNLNKSKNFFWENYQNTYNRIWNI